MHIYREANKYADILVRHEISLIGGLLVFEDCPQFEYHFVLEDLRGTYVRGIGVIFLFGLRSLNMHKNNN